MNDEVMRMGRTEKREKKMKKDEDETRLEIRKMKIHSFETFFVPKNSIEGKNSTGKNPLVG